MVEKNFVISGTSNNWISIYQHYWE